MTNVQSLSPEVREDKYPLLGIIAALGLNFAAPFISSLLPLAAFVICVVRIMRYDERVFATDYSLLACVSLLFCTSGGMSLLIYLCLFADVWYFMRRGIKAEAAVVLMLVLLNYLLLRMQMSIDRFALCFGQLFLLRILLPRQDRHSAERTAKAFCIGMLLVSVYALVFRNTWQLQAIRGPEAPAFFGSTAIRFYGLFRDPNYYSLLLVTALALLTKLKDSRCISWFLFLTGALLLIICGVLTYSKTFFLTLLLLVLIYLLWQFWNKRVFKGILMTLTILLLGGILLLSEGSPFAVVLTRLTNSVDLGDLTTGRSDVFMQYFRVITQSLGNVLVGVGLGQPGLGQDPHNLYLEIVYYVGLTGLVLMGVYYVALIRAIDADLKQQNFIARYIVLFMVMVFHFTLHGMTTLTAFASFFMAALAMLIIPKEETPCQD